PFLERHRDSPPSEPLARRNRSEASHAHRTGDLFHHFTHHLRVRKPRGQVALRDDADEDALAIDHGDPADLPLRMASTALSTSSSGRQVTGSRDMTSSALVFFGSRPSPTMQIARSRSVTIPMSSLPSPSWTMGTAPTFSSFIILATLAALS